MRTPFTSISQRLKQLPQRQFLVFVFCCSLVIRLPFVFWNPTGERIDLYEHGDIAHNILSGNGFTMHWPYSPMDPVRQQVRQLPIDHEGAFLPPVNPYLLVSFYSVFGENQTALTAYGLLICLLSALVPVVIYKIVRYFASEHISRLAALLGCINIFAAFSVATFSGSVLSHLLALAGIYSIFRANEKKSLGSYLFVGLLIGGMTLLRSEYFLLGPALIVLSAMLFKERLSVRIQYVATALLVHVAIVSPWVYRNYQLFDKFVPVLSHPWYEIWRGNNAQANGTSKLDDGRTLWIDSIHNRAVVQTMDQLPYDAKFEVVVDSVFKTEVLGFWQQDPLHAFGLGLKKVAMFTTSDFNRGPAANALLSAINFILFSMSLVGIVSLLRQKNIRYGKIAGALSLCFLLYYLALTFFTIMLPRYQIYVFNTLLPMAAVGFAVTRNALGVRH